MAGSIPSNPAPWGSGTLHAEHSSSGQVPAGAAQASQPISSRQSPVQATSQAQSSPDLPPGFSLRGIATGRPAIGSSSGAGLGSHDRPTADDMEVDNGLPPLPSSPPPIPPVPASPMVSLSKPCNGTHKACAPSAFLTLMFPVVFFPGLSQIAIAVLFLRCKCLDGQCTQPSSLCRGQSAHHMEACRLLVVQAASKGLAALVSLSICVWLSLGLYMCLSCSGDYFQNNAEQTTLSSPAFLRSTHASVLVNHM